jgi:hypothetical protein
MMLATRSSTSGTGPLGARWTRHRSAGGYSTIQEEGAGLTVRSTLNFVGGGFTAADDAANTRTNVTLDATLNSLAAYNTNGILTQTAADTFTGRTITGTTNYITLTNGDGVAGNPTINIGANVVTTDTAQTVSALKTFSSTSGVVIDTGTGTNTALLTLTGRNAGAAATSTITASSTGQLTYNTAGTTSHILTIGGTAKLTVGNTTIDVNTLRITGVVDPTGAQDVATKNYVDGVSAGLDAKGSVRAATTAAGTLASSFANGSAIDGVTLATGDRILIKDQAAAQENGIYTVNASGAPTRATDVDSWAEVPGAYTWVEQGTVNADTGWVSTANAGGTLNTTAMPWTLFSSATALIAGAGLNKTGNTIDVVATGSGISVNADDIALSSALQADHTLISGATAGMVAHTGANTVANRTITGTANRVTITNGDGAAGNPTVDIHASYVGQNTITTLGTIGTGVWNGTTIGTTYGGTGVSNPTTNALVVGAGASAMTTILATATAGTNYIFGTGVNSAVPAAKPFQFATNVGDGSSTSITVTHNLGTKDVIVQVYDNTTPFAQVEVDVEHTSTTAVTIRFTTAPASAAYRCVVAGLS